MSKQSKCKTIAKKILKYGPPFVTQIVTFTATRALANEYQDYGGDDYATPLAAKAALVSITIISSITGVLASAMGWGVDGASKLVRVGDFVLNLVGLAIAIALGAVMLQSHEVLRDAGLACGGPNIRVCLPPASMCSKTETPPCDAYSPKDKRAEIVSYPTKEYPTGELLPIVTPEESHDGAGYAYKRIVGQEIGWKFEDDRAFGGKSDIYMSMQYQTYGDVLGVVNDYDGNVREVNPKVQTTDAAFHKAPEEKLELAMLERPSVMGATRIPWTSGVALPRDTSDCEQKTVKSFDGAKVKTSSCGATRAIAWTQSAIDRGDRCRYGCAGSNADCLGRGAPKKSGDDSIADFVGEFIAYFTQAVNTAYVNASIAQQTANGQANGEYGGCAGACGSAACVAACADTRDEALAAAQKDWDAFVASTADLQERFQAIVNPHFKPNSTDIPSGTYPEALYAHRSAHLDSSTTPSSTEKVARATMDIKQTCVDSNGFGAISATTPLCAAPGTQACCIHHSTNPSSNLPCSAVAKTGGNEINCDPTGAYPSLPDSMRRLDCGTIKNHDLCYLCPKETIECGASGVDTISANIDDDFRGNATVGFGTDIEDSRYAPPDWMIPKRTWCGGKLLTDSYEGFFGLTVTSAILMGVSALTAAWDGITQIEENSRAKRIAVATGIILTEIANVVLFLIPSFHTAMLIHVGHESAIDVAGVPKATIISSFITKEYAWASPYYRALVTLLAVVQGALAAQALAMTIASTGRAARGIGICKVALVSVGMYLVWRPNFDMLLPIDTIDAAYTELDLLTTESEAMMADEGTYSQDPEAICDRLEASGALMIKPQADIGYEASGWELTVVWVLFLLIGLADEAELLILKKLARAEKATPAEGTGPTNSVEKTVIHQSA